LPSVMLDIDKINKRFGGITALDSISFHVLPGQIVSLIGPNGAGKTTLVNILSGFDSCDKGRIIFNNVDITRKPAEDRVRSGMTRIFQDSRLFEDLNVVENIAAAQYFNVDTGFVNSILWPWHDKRIREKCYQKADELLQKFDINEYRSIYPSELSHGVRRRVEIARAVATNPSLLLLDEPAAGLVGKETQKIMKLIRGLSDSGTSSLILERLSPGEQLRK